MLHDFISEKLRSKYQQSKIRNLTTADNRATHKDKEEIEFQPGPAAVIFFKGLQLIFLCEKANSQKTGKKNFHYDRATKGDWKKILSAREVHQGNAWSLVISESHLVYLLTIHASC